MKSLIKNAIRICTFAVYSKWNILIPVSNKFNILCNYIYSLKYCRFFNCKDVYFRRKLNFSRGE